MALQANNYQLPQEVVLPAAYLKVEESTVRMVDATSGAITFKVPVVTIFYRVFKDASARENGAPPFPDTPQVVVKNPTPSPNLANHLEQLYSWLALGLNIPNVMV